MKVIDDRVDFGVANRKKKKKDIQFKAFQEGKMA